MHIQEIPLELTERIFFDSENLESARQVNKFYYQSLNISDYLKCCFEKSACFKAPLAKRFIHVFEERIKDEPHLLRIPQVIKPFPLRLFKNLKLYHQDVGLLVDFFSDLLQDKIATYSRIRLFAEYLTMWRTLILDYRLKQGHSSIKMLNAFPLFTPRAKLRKAREFSMHRSFLNYMIQFLYHSHKVKFKTVNWFDHQEITYFSSKELLPTKRFYSFKAFFLNYFIMEKISLEGSLGNVQKLQKILDGKTSHTNIVRYINQPDANFTQKDKKTFSIFYGPSPLTEACVIGNLEVVKFFMENELASNRLEDGISYAIREGHDQIVEYLFNFFKVNSQNSISYLMDIALDSCNFEMVGFILDRFKTDSLLGKVNEKKFLEVIDSGNVDLARNYIALLRKYSIKIDLGLPTVRAFESGSYEMVELLLNYAGEVRENEILK